MFYGVSTLLGWTKANGDFNETSRSLSTRKILTDMQTILPVKLSLGTPPILGLKSKEISTSKNRDTLMSNHIFHEINEGCILQIEILN